MFPRQNPVAVAELRYQKLLTSARHGNRLHLLSYLPTSLVYLIVLVFVANILLSFIVGHGIPPVDRFERFTYHRDEDLLFSLTILWIVILHLRLMFKTLS